MLFKLNDSKSIWTTGATPRNTNREKLQVAMVRLNVHTLIMLSD